MEKGVWKNLMQCCYHNYALALSNYIMLRHSFILCYIYNCISKLNELLENEEMDELLLYSYHKLSLLLQHVNIIYSPLILQVLVGQVIVVALNLTIMFNIYLCIDELSAGDFVHVYIIPMLPLNICMYFLICGRLFRSTNQHRINILMEYNSRKQVCVINIV